MPASPCGAGLLMAYSSTRLEAMPAFAPDHPAPSLKRRLIGQFLPGKISSRPGSLTARSFAPRPVQFTLPLAGASEAEDANPAQIATPLFHETRTVEPVLSYEQASLEQVIPGATASPLPAQDRLLLPGSTGLILYEAHAGAMAFDWMRWGSQNATPFGATVDIQALCRNGRSQRRLARRRCVVPLTRFSIPIRDGAVWSHRWIEPAPGAIVCAAGLWSAEKDADGTFAMVTGAMVAGSGQPHEGPLLLAEEEILLWLRAPLEEALALADQITRAASPDAEGQESA